MKNSRSSQSILADLDTVMQERATRAADPQLAERARAVREFQAARFRRTYADLLAAPDTRDAALFFLNELYGEQDFLDRDAQFRRTVPAIVRLFSAEVVHTVSKLAELHAVSERMDTRMARTIPDAGRPDAAAYGQAWRKVGEPATRARQIELVIDIGRALIHYTRHPAIGKALHIMRLPARAAGLAALQSFLERGFDTFGAMPDPDGFLNTIRGREEAFAASQFAGG